MKTTDLWNGPQQKQMTLKHNSFPWNKDGDFRKQILCPNMDKIRSKLHTWENAQAMLHPNKENVLTKKKRTSSEPELNASRL